MANKLTERIMLHAGVGENGSSLIFPIVFSVIVLASLALSLVWLNIERTKMAYSVRTLQRELAQTRDLNSKLEVERGLLLSPRELGKKATRMGLKNAEPGQIRRMAIDAEDSKEPVQTGATQTEK